MDGDRVRMVVKFKEMEKISLSVRMVLIFTITSLFTGYQLHSDIVLQTKPVQH